MRAVSVLLLSVFGATLAAQGLPVPERIGGTIDYMGQVLDQSSGSGILVRVSRPDQSDLVPAAADGNGLGQEGRYIVDIPHFQAASQPGGTQPGDQLLVRFFDGNVEMTVISPPSGQIVAAAGGSVRRVDLVVIGVPRRITLVIEQWPNLGILDMVDIVSDTANGS